MEKKEKKANMSRNKKGAEKKSYGKQQERMLIALRGNGCNVSHACRACGISRQTHYDWIDKFDKYKKEFQEIEEGMIDFVETALMKSIKEGNVTAQIFYLKTRGKHRGYIEKQEVDLGGDVVTNVNLVVKGKNSDKKKDGEK